MYKIEGIDLDFDPSMESPFRGRSNTWPLPRPNDFPDVDKCDSDGTGALGSAMDQAMIPATAQEASPLEQVSGQTGPKKNTSRRNAWGNMSYADLITQAINGSPEKRLTLSQIYDWMVQNVPYFKDKGDSNSSAGWKVSQHQSLNSKLLQIMSCCKSCPRFCCECEAQKKRKTKFKSLMSIKTWAQSNH